MEQVIMVARSKRTSRQGLYFGPRFRGDRIVALAVEEAVLAHHKHLFGTDGLGLYSALAERILWETMDTALELGLDPEEHEQYVARILIHNV
jgi:hypothetical protein